MAQRRASYSGIDAFQEACQREHQGSMTGTDAGHPLLEKIEAKLRAGHSLSEELLAIKFQARTTASLEEDLARIKRLVADGQVQKTEPVDLVARKAELEQELERRRKCSKKWLAQVWSFFFDCACHHLLIMKRLCQCLLRCTFPAYSMSFLQMIGSQVGPP